MLKSVYTFKDHLYMHTYIFHILDTIHIELVWYVYVMQL